MARGLDEEQARNLLIQGFLRVQVPGLPPQVQALIKTSEKLLAAHAAV
jgi:Fe-S cluster assembly scaffold protein SufB